MIKIMNPNFAKEVKKELKRHKTFTQDIYVSYYIDNSTKTGTLTVKVYNGDVSTEITTAIEFDYRIVSCGIRDGKPINRIIFNVHPTDMVLDIVTQDHYVEAYKNAYNWEMKVFEEGKTPNNTFYHISMIDFHNAKRTKSTRVQMVCFDGCEMIVTGGNV